jgi:hypothetical protein
MISAWVLILLVSDLPDILWNKFTEQTPEWLFWGKVGIIPVVLGLCYIWNRIRPL